MAVIPFAAGVEDAVSAAPQHLTESSREKLKQFIARIERLEEDKAAIAADIKDTYGEAKSTGFDVKALRQVVRLRKLDRDERAEQEAILDLYLSVIGEI